MIAHDDFTLVLENMFASRAHPRQGFTWHCEGSFEDCARAHALIPLERRGGYVRAVDRHGRAYGLMRHPEMPRHDWAAPLR